MKILYKIDIKNIFTYISREAHRKNMTSTTYPLHAHIDANNNITLRSRGKLFEMVSVAIISEKTRKLIVKISCERRDVVDTLKNMGYSQTVITKVQDTLDRKYGPIV